jgi:hypothetical protein
MTNETKPSAKDVKFWEGIKQDMLDRADIVADFDDAETEALNELHYASSSMSEDVHHLMHFAYRDVVNLCRYSDILRNDFGWHHSECKKSARFLVWRLNYPLACGMKLAMLVAYLLTRLRCFTGYQAALQH